MFDTWFGVKLCGMFENLSAYFQQFIIFNYSIQIYIAERKHMIRNYNDEYFIRLIWCLYFKLFLDNEVSNLMPYKRNRRFLLIAIMGDKKSREKIEYTEWVNKKWFTAPVQKCTFFCATLLYGVFSIFFENFYFFWYSNGSKKIREPFFS